ncbi:MAG: hypothetical protein IPK25_12680 [Saprospiraceae bacterium]|nr:hypothetical protein [Saprospiraceae bacterium]
MEKLAFYRSQQELYFGESFGAIIGYKGNGAIIHYAPPKNGSSLIKKTGFFWWTVVVSTTMALQILQGH